MLNPDLCGGGGEGWALRTKAQLSENCSGALYRFRERQVCKVFPAKKIWGKFYDMARMLLVFRARPLHVKAGLYHLWNLESDATKNYQNARSKRLGNQISRRVVQRTPETSILQKIWGLNYMKVSWAGLWFNRTVRF